MYYHVNTVETKEYFYVSCVNRAARL